MNDLLYEKLDPMLNIPYKTDEEYEEDEWDWETIIMRKGK